MKRRLNSPWFLGLGLALLTLALRWPSLGLPLDRDEGTYATMAMAWSRHWGFPYLDFFDHKPPLLYALYAWAFQWGGWTATGLRAFSLAWQAATAVAFGRFLQRWTPSTALAWWGGLAFVVLSCAWRTQAIAANAEGWGWLPILLGLLCLQPQRLEQAAWRWLAWGAAAGLAACIKQPFYVFAAGLPLCLEAGSRRWPALGCTSLGLALSQLPCVWWLVEHAALRQACQAIFAFNSAYSTPLAVASIRGLAGLCYHLRFEEGALWILALLACAPAPAEDQALQRLSASVLALGLLASALSGRWYPHYAVLWIPGLALMAASGASRPSVRSLRLGLTAAALLGFVWAQQPFWREPDGPARSRHLLGLANFGEAPLLASWVDAHSGADDRLLIWGADAEIYFLAQRRPATPFLSHYSFTGETPAWPGAEDELWQAVADPRTRVVVLSDRLDGGQDLQRRLGLQLQKNFELRHDPGSPFWVGLRRS